MSGFDMNDWSRHQLLAVEQALTAWVPADAPAGLGEAMRYAAVSYTHLTLPTKRIV